jgi:hypothetical protein
MGFAKSSTHPTVGSIDKTMNQQRTVVMVWVWAQIASFNFPNALISALASTAC